MQDIRLGVTMSQKLELDTPPAENEKMCIKSKQAHKQNQKPRQQGFGDATSWSTGNGIEMSPTFAATFYPQILCQCTGHVMNTMQKAMNWRLLQPHYAVRKMTLGYQVNKDLRVKVPRYRETKGSEPNILSTSCPLKAAAG